MGLANPPVITAPSPEAVTVVLNPEHSAILHGAGLTREDIAQELHERSFVEASIAKGYSASSQDRIRRTEWPSKAPSNPDRRAGGSGVYSMVMPSWCVGAHANSAVSVKVEADMFCVIPGLAG